MRRSRRTLAVWALYCFCILLGAVLGLGCYNPHAVEDFLPEAGRPLSAMEYHVYPPDVVTISSLKVPEIDGNTQQVRPDGKINLPLLGEISVAGKTPRQIEDAIDEKAKEFYDEVDSTTVIVTGYYSQRFYVFGEVEAPGPMAWTGKDTLLDALARAQPTDFAWPERITVVRGGGPQEGGYSNAQSSIQYSLIGVRPPTAGHHPKKITVNLAAMVEFGDLSNNILLQPNDVIHVRMNPFAQTALIVDQVFSPIRAASNGLGDLRRMVRHLRWMKAGMPSDEDIEDSTIIVR